MPIQVSAYGQRSTALSFKEARVRVIDSGTGRCRTSKSSIETKSSIRPFVVHLFASRRVVVCKINYSRLRKPYKQNLLIHPCLGLHYSFYPPSLLHASSTTVLDVCNALNLKNTRLLHAPTKTFVDVIMTLTSLSDIREFASWCSKMYFQLRIMI